MKTVKAFIEKGNDGTFGVYVDLEDTTLNYGIHGEGKTAKEAIDDFMASYEDMKAIYKEEGEEFVEAYFEFHYDIPSFLSYYNNIITLAGLEKVTGVRQGQLSHYLNGYRNPSKKTAKKIQEKLHNFGEELSQVKFI